MSIKPQQNNTNPLLQKQDSSSHKKNDMQQVYVGNMNNNYMFPMGNQQVDKQNAPGGPPGNTIPQNIM